MVGGSFRKYYHFVAPSFKLELARFSAWLRIQDGAECGNMKQVGLSRATLEFQVKVFILIIVKSQVRVLKRLNLD